MSFSVIHCRPAVLPHFVTPARHRSSSIQSIHLLFSRPVGFHWCRGLHFWSVSCPSSLTHAQAILIVPLWSSSTLVRAVSSVWSFRLWSSLYRHLHNKISSEPANFTGICSCFWRVHDSLPYVNIGTNSTVKQSRFQIHTNVMPPENRLAILQ